MCGGDGLVTVYRLYVGVLPTGRNEMPGASKCRSCKGSGAFCKNEKPCGGLLQSSTWKRYPPA